MSQFKSKFIGLLILVLCFYLLTGCEKTATEIKNKDNWKTKTLKIFMDAKYNKGGYVPIELLNKDSRGTSLDQTWRAVEIFKLMNINPPRKKEIISNLNTYLHEQDLDVRDICKVIAILEVIDQNNNLKKDLQKWIDSNYQSGGWFSNNTYNKLKNETLDNPKNKILDRLVKLDTLYFITTFNKENLSIIQKKAIKEYLVNSWNTLNANLDKDFTEKYLILASLTKLEYGISELKGIQDFEISIFNEYKIIAANPYQDILRMSMILELAKVFDPQFSLDDNFIKKIVEQQKGGFPLREDAPASGLGSYNVIKMLYPNYIEKINKEKLITYLNNNQSTATGLFYDDKVFKANLLATSISILTLNNLGESSYFKKEIAFVRSALKEKVEAKDIRLVELFYTLKVLKETQTLKEEKNYLTDYIRHNKISLQDIKDIYYFQNIIEFLELSLPSETQMSIINASKTYLSQPIILEGIPDLEGIVYSIEILQKYQEPLNSKERQKILAIFQKTKNNKEITIMDQLNLYKGLKMLGEPISDMSKSNILNYLSNSGGIKIHQDKDIITLQSTFFGVELLKLANIL